MNTLVIDFTPHGYREVGFRKMMAHHHDGGVSGWFPMHIDEDWCGSDVYAAHCTRCPYFVWTHR